MSKNSPRPRAGFRRAIDQAYIKTRKALRNALFPLYARFGLRSVVALVVPGYRQVTKSPGGKKIVCEPLRGHDHSFTIATVGDYGSGKAASFAVRDLIESEQASAVVTLGDNIYYETGFASLVGDVYGTWIRAGTFFPATGNHDYREGRGIALFDRFFTFLDGHRWYSVSIGPVDFFILDSHQALHHPDVFEAQRAWLEQATQDSRARWKIVVTHHPPHSARSRSQHEFRFPYDKWGVCMVMSGHDHTMQHLLVDTVHYVVNGVGGGSLHYFEEVLEGTEFRLAEHYGAVMLDVSRDELTVRFVTVDSGVVHQFAVAPALTR
jgi:hypothetical protein